MDRSDLLRRLDENMRRIRERRPFTDAGAMRDIRGFHRIPCVYTSNAIEGVSYTLTETKILIEDGLTAGGRPFRDAMAVLGLAAGYDHMFSLAGGNGVSEADLLKLHSMLAGGLCNDARAGAYRDCAAFITGSSRPLPPPDEVPALMAEMLAELAAMRGHPVERAARLHRDIALIHPFADGNGRVARLAMNIILIQNGFLPAAIPPVIRQEHVDSLRVAHVDDSHLVDLICRCELEAQKDFMRVMHIAPRESGPDSPVDTASPLFIRSVPPAGQTAELARMACSVCVRNAALHVSPSDLAPLVREDLRHVIFDEFPGTWIRRDGIDAGGMPTVSWEFHGA